MRRALVTAGALLWFTACTGGAGDTGSAELADIGHDVELTRKVADYYRAHAQEGGFSCTGLELQGISGSRVLRQSGGTAAVEIDYAFTSDDNSDESPLRCNGFGTRVFELTRAGEGWQVVGMSGETAG
jgi:hypothetical protein